MNYNYNPQNDPFTQDGFAPMPKQPAGHAKGYATAALILGIASVFCTCCCCCLYMIAPVLSIIAIVMACLSRRDNGKKMSGMALAGLILAIIGFIVFLFLFSLEMVFLSMSEAELQAIFDEYLQETLGMSYEEYMQSIAPAITE